MNFVPVGNNYEANSLFVKKDLFSIRNWDESVLNNSDIVFVEGPEFIINENDEIVISKSFETESETFYVVQSEEQDTPLSSNSVSDLDDPLYIGDNQTSIETDSFAALIKHKTLGNKESTEEKFRDSSIISNAPNPSKRLTENVQKRNRHTYFRPSAASSANNQQSNPDNGKVGDLSWLINFRLDGLIKNNLIEEEPCKNDSALESEKSKIYHKIGYCLPLFGS